MSRPEGGHNIDSSIERQEFQTHFKRPQRPGYQTNFKRPGLQKLDLPELQRPKRQHHQRVPNGGRPDFDAARPEIVVDTEIPQRPNTEFQRPNTEFQRPNFNTRFNTRQQDLVEFELPELQRPKRGHLQRPGGGAGNRGHEFKRPQQEFQNPPRLGRPPQPFVEAPTREEIFNSAEQQPFQRPPRSKLNNPNFASEEKKAEESISTFGNSNAFGNSPAFEFPSLPGFSSDDFSFGGFEPPRKDRRNQRPPVNLNNLYNNENSVFTDDHNPNFKVQVQDLSIGDLYDQVPELVTPEVKQPSRPTLHNNNNINGGPGGIPFRNAKRKRPIFQNALVGLSAVIPKRKRKRPGLLRKHFQEQRPGNGGGGGPGGLHGHGPGGLHAGHQPFQEQRPLGGAGQPFQDGPIVNRVTTPRPIPTPGPGDFPSPPPRRPRPPPTHPTHPPPITHPPEHYEHVTQKHNPLALNPLYVGAIQNTVEPFENRYDHESEENDYYDYDYNDIGGGGGGEQSEGFFEFPGGFPSLSELGSGFESMKIRNRRSLPAEDDGGEMLQAAEARRMLRNRGRGRGRGRRRGAGGPRGGHQESRAGFGFRENFWDGVDHDPQNFFSNFGEDAFANRNYNSGGGGGTSSAGVRKQRYSVPNYYQDTYQDTYRRDPYTEQTIQSYPADNEYYTDSFSGGIGGTGGGGYDGSVVNNELLGSGNFEVIKGGTFYDDDTYYYSTYNTRPQYGQQFFENFRDFADIKNDRYNSNNIGYNNYYPKYK